MFYSLADAPGTLMTLLITAVPYLLFESFNGHVPTFCVMAELACSVL